MNKLGFNEKQAGRMTLGKFFRLYQSYKDVHDEEMTLQLNKMRYCDQDKSETLDDAIPF